MESVTRNDLLEALHDYLGSIPQGDGATTKELMAHFGRGNIAVKKMVCRLLEEGRAEVVLLTRTRMDGLVTTVRGYRLKPADATSGPDVT